MMNKIKQWMLAAILTICGASVFTSCSSDNDDNPAQEQAKKNRKEFVEHTSTAIKDLAENANFGAWVSLNWEAQVFNQMVLNNPNFEKTVSSAFFQKAKQSIKPVEDDSELSAMGYKMYGTVDLTDFNYRFLMKDDFTGFDIEEGGDGFELYMNSYNPGTQMVERSSTKVSLKASGSESFKIVIPSRQMEGLAIILVVPSDLRFALSDPFFGPWEERFICSFKNQVEVAEGNTYAQLSRDNWYVSGELYTDIKVPTVEKKPDVTTFNFAIDVDHTHGKGNFQLGFVQNGRRMIDVSMKETGPNNFLDFDLSQYTSKSSILDVLAALWDGRSIDEAKLTLLDDLTTTISVSDMTKAMQLSREGASARRNYADQATIDQYTQQLDELVKAEITCKGINQTIPMKLVTTKFGIDWWTMPAFNFADENGYVSLTDLLDPESVTYGINIIDHAAEPMQQSIIIVRQLLLYLSTLMASNAQQQSNE